jgi:hypothetical protein
LERLGGVMWTGLVWIRTGTGRELLWIRYWTFGLQEMLGNYRVAYHLVASRVVLSSIELVIHYVEGCKSKAIPVTDCGGLQRCLDSRLRDGGKVVSPTHRPHSNPQKHYFSASVLISIRGWVNPRV